jgi:hypothetical protein
MGLGVQPCREPVDRPRRGARRTLTLSAQAGLPLADLPPEPVAAVAVAVAVAVASVHLPPGYPVCDGLVKAPAPTPGLALALTSLSPSETSAGGWTSGPAHEDGRRRAAGPGQERKPCAAGLLCPCCCGSASRRGVAGHHGPGKPRRGAGWRGSADLVKSGVADAVCECADDGPRVPQRGARAVWLRSGLPGAERTPAPRLQASHRALDAANLTHPRPLPVLPVLCAWRRNGTRTRRWLSGEV